MGIEHQPHDVRSAQHGETLVRVRNRRVTNGILVTLVVAVEAAWVLTLVGALVWLVVR